MLQTNPRSTATTARGHLASCTGHAKASHWHFEFCGPLRDFRKVLSIGWSCSCEKQPLKEVWTGAQVGWSGVSESPAWAIGVSQVDEDSDMASSCAYRLCGGRAQRKNNGTCQHFFLGESWHSSPHPKARQFSVFPYVPSIFWAAVLRGSVSKWVWVHPAAWCYYQ